MKRQFDEFRAQAREATERVEAERLFAAALAEVSGCWRARSLLREMAAHEFVPQASIGVAAERTLELACEERDVWGFRDVASVRLGRLDDVEGARRALEVGRLVFAEPRTDTIGRAAATLGKPAVTRGYEWVLLGAGFSETLQDDAGLRSCLEAGLASARAAQNADDLCAIAAAWGKDLDRAQGLALLREAEALAANGSCRPWVLANGWHTLGDAEGARRVLEAALESAQDCAAALHVFQAWVSQREFPSARRAVDRASVLAAGAHDWLAIAEALFDARFDEALLRGAVQQAEQHASQEERARVARAYWLWLRDGKAAARLGPRGVPPEELRVRLRTLSDWETSASSLFDWLRARATHEVLDGIAQADYGIAAHKHYAALRDICRTGLLPRPLDWEPHEVLALTRWSSGADVDHLARALSCTLLCFELSESDELVTNGPILAESCVVLGAEATALAQQFFGWLAETAASGSDGGCGDPDELLALLLLLMLRAAANPDDARLGGLARSLTEHPRLSEVAPCIEHSSSAERWRELCARYLAPMRASCPSVAGVLDGLGWG